MVSSFFAGLRRSAKPAVRCHSQHDGLLQAHLSAETEQEKRYSVSHDFAKQASIVSAQIEVQQHLLAGTLNALYNHANQVRHTLRSPNYLALFPEAYHMPIAGVLLDIAGQVYDNDMHQRVVRPILFAGLEDESVLTPAKLMAIFAGNLPDKDAEGKATEGYYEDYGVFSNGVLKIWGKYSQSQRLNQLDAVLCFAKAHKYPLEALFQTYYALIILGRLYEHFTIKELGEKGISAKFLQAQSNLLESRVAQLKTQMQPKIDRWVVVDDTLNFRDPFGYADSKRSWWLFWDWYDKDYSGQTFVSRAHQHAGVRLSQRLSYALLGPDVRKYLADSGRYLKALGRPALEMATAMIRFGRPKGSRQVFAFMGFSQALFNFMVNDLPMALLKATVCFPFRLIRGLSDILPNRGAWCQVKHDLNKLGYSLELLVTCFLWVCVRGLLNLFVRLTRSLVAIVATLLGLVVSGVGYLLCLGYYTAWGQAIPAAEIGALHLDAPRPANVADFSPGYDQAQYRAVVPEESAAYAPVLARLAQVGYSAEQQARIMQEMRGLQVYGRVDDINPEALDFEVVQSLFA